MARIRSTHPGQWRDEDFVELSFGARLLALAIRNEADDQGVFEWKPKQIKMNCFPADSVDIDALLSEIVAANIVKTYEIDGHKYGAIRNFRLYQRPKTPNAIYPLTDEIRKYVAIDGRKGGKAQALDASISEIDSDEEEVISETIPKSDQQMKEEGDKMKEVKEDSSLRSEPAPASKPSKARSQKAEHPEFAAFYKAFPRHEAPADGAKAYAAAIANGATPMELLAGAERYAAHVASAREDKKFTKLPATWLNKGCWRDEYETGIAVCARTPVEIHPSWNGKKNALASKIGEDNFFAYFAAAKLDMGPPAVIEVPTAVMKTKIEQKFGSPLRALFGSVEISVVRDASA